MKLFSYVLFKCKWVENEYYSDIKNVKLLCNKVTMDMTAKQLFFVYLFLLLLPFNIKGQLADHSGPCVFAGGTLNAVCVSFQTPRLPLGHPGFFYDLAWF